MSQRFLLSSLETDRKGKFCWETRLSVQWTPSRSAAPEAAKTFSAFQAQVRRQRRSQARWPVVGGMSCLTCFRDDDKNGVGSSGRRCGDGKGERSGDRLPCPSASGLSLRVQSGFGVDFSLRNRFTEKAISKLCRWKFLIRNVKFASPGLMAWKCSCPIAATQTRAEHPEKAVQFLFFQNLRAIKI